MELVAASAYIEVTVQKGLAWLVARGLISVREEPNGSLVLKEGGHPNKQAEALLNDIQELLLEAVAYRNHCLSADKDTLF